MPTSYIQKMATKHGKSVSDYEKKWDKAKDLGKDKGYDYIMGIFKRMIGESSTCAEGGEHNLSAPDFSYCTKCKQGDLNMKEKYREQAKKILESSNLSIKWKDSSPSTIADFKKAGLNGTNYQDADVELPNGEEIWYAKVDGVRYRVDVDSNSKLTIHKESQEPVNYGKVTVYPPTVKFKRLSPSTINWPSISSATAEDARSLMSDLQKAIAKANEFDTARGVK